MRESIIIIVHVRDSFVIAQLWTFCAFQKGRELYRGLFSDCLAVCFYRAIWNADAVLR